MRDVKIRLLKNDDFDYKLLEKWYKEEEVYLNFEQRILSYEEIKRKYYPRTLKNTNIPVYMVEYNSVPIGIIQYKLITDEDRKLYKLKDDNSYEIDIFIGEVKEHNKGIGSTAINLLIDILEKEKHANTLVMCPLISNKKAISCYKKCGFSIKRYFKTEDTAGKLQTYALMIREL